MENDNNIPAIFHSFLTEKPFENCIMCEKHLLEENTGYFIEKAIRDNQVEIEYAICFDCAENMQGKMSDESLENIKSYFERNRVAIMEHLFAGIDTKNLLSKCLVKGTPVNEMTEYQVAGAFMGNKIIFEPFPFIMSMAATDEINELLSAKTKEEMDGFIDNFIGVPPDWLEIIKNNRPIFI